VAGTHYPKPAKYSQDYEALSAEETRAISALDARTDALQIENRKLNIEKLRNAQAHEVLENSAAGRVGKFIAPVFYPLGFDWKTSIGVTGAFFAREVIVSTMGICYQRGRHGEFHRDVAEGDEGRPVGGGNAARGPPGLDAAGGGVADGVRGLLHAVPIDAGHRQKGDGTLGLAHVHVLLHDALAWLAAFAVYQGGSLLGMNQ